MSTNQGPKYMYDRNIPKWRFWNLSEPEKYGRGLMGLIKNAYGEQPMVFTTAVIALFSLGCIVKGINERLKDDNYNLKQYKRFYTIMRPDDPRISLENNQWLYRGKNAVKTSEIRDKI